MKRQEYRQRKGVFVNVEQNAWEAFQELCDKEKISTSLKFNELLQEELQKNEIGLRANPIQVAYESSHSTAKKNCSHNTLDYFIEKGFVTKQYLRDEIKGKPLDRLEKLSAFGRTITMVSELEIGYVKTGKYTVY